MAIRLNWFTRYIEPTDALMEALFGLIMVLTFTLGAGLVIDEGPDATRKLLLAVLGCNAAWGVIDAVMYLMNGMLERSRKATLISSLQRINNKERALAIIAGQLDSGLEPITEAEDRLQLYEAIWRHLQRLEPERTRLTRIDFLGAAATFWLVVISTIPATIPFLVLEDRFVALRVSNVLLLAALFIAGFRWARVTNGNPWIVGSALLCSGLALVAVAIALGG